MGKGLRMHVSLKLNLGNIKKQNHKGTKSTLCGHNKLWQFRKCFFVGIPQTHKENLCDVKWIGTQKC